MIGVLTETEELATTDECGFRRGQLSLEPACGQFAIRWELRSTARSKYDLTASLALF